MKIKREESMMSKYGVKYTVQIDGIMEKIEKTCLKNNGFTCAFKVMKFIGENSPNWKGGATTEKIMARKCWDYKLWRNEVYRRDGYTCQCCGIKHKDIEAHHIKNFSEHIESRYDGNNGITLCKKCHNPNRIGSFHNIYGMKNNNQEQLDEYIKNYKINNNT